MAAKKKEDEELPGFVIITGLSGSGMSSATDSFEDLGYFCVDNLPLTMLSTFADTSSPMTYCNLPSGPSRPNCRLLSLLWRQPQ